MNYACQRTLLKKMAKSSKILKRWILCSVISWPDRFCSWILLLNSKSRQVVAYSNESAKIRAGQKKSLTTSKLPYFSDRVNICSRIIYRCMFFSTCTYYCCVSYAVDSKGIHGLEHEILNFEWSKIFHALKIPWPRFTLVIGTRKRRILLCLLIVMITT